MKGIELPINILVIVAVAIIVLLGIIALFYSSWFTGTGPVTSQTAVSQACNIATRTGCEATPLTITMTGYKGYLNLHEFCVGEYQTTTDEQCLSLACGLQCTPAATTSE
jgi:hypothetical protein